MVTVEILKEILNKTLDQKLSTLKIIREEHDNIKSRTRELEQKMEEMENYTRRCSSYAIT